MTKVLTERHFRPVVQRLYFNIFFLRMYKFTVFGFLKGSRVYPARIQGTESVATID